MEERSMGSTIPVSFSMENIISWYWGNYISLLRNNWKSPRSRGSQRLRKCVQNLCPTFFSILLDMKIIKLLCKLIYTLRLIPHKDVKKIYGPVAWTPHYAAGQIEDTFSATPGKRDKRNQDSIISPSPVYEWGKNSKATNHFITKKRN